MSSVHNTHNLHTSLCTADTLMRRYKSAASFISFTRSVAQSRCRRLSDGSTNTLWAGSVLHTSANTASATPVLPIIEAMKAGSLARSSSWKTVHPDQSYGGNIQNVHFVLRSLASKSLKSITHATMEINREYINEDLMEACQG